MYKATNAANEIHTEWTEHQFLGGQIYIIDLDAISHIECVPIKAKYGAPIRHVARHLGKLKDRPAFVCNASAFNKSTHSLISSLVHEGKSYYMTDTYGFGFYPTGHIEFSYMNAYGAPEYIGANQTLIIGGKKGFATNRQLELERCARTFIGLSAKHFMVGFVPGTTGATLTEVATRLRDFGCEYAVNLGGHQHTSICTPTCTYDQDTNAYSFLAIYLNNHDECEINRNEEPVLKREIIASYLVQDCRYKNGVKLRNRSYYSKKITSIPYTVHDSVVRSSAEKYVEWHGYMTPDKKYFFVRNPIDGKCGYIDSRNTDVVL